MEVRPVCLDAGDAVELGELLEFLGDWLVRDGDSLAASFRGVVGSDGYDVGVAGRPVAVRLPARRQQRRAAPGRMPASRLPTQCATV